MDTGAYYRLTGFARYNAIGCMENAHFMWLQIFAELGIIIGIVLLGLLILPACYLFSQPVSLNPTLLCLNAGLLCFWFCNVVGQSLLQQEIFWLYAILAGITFRGVIPVRITGVLRRAMSQRGMAGFFCAVLAVQVAVWTKRVTAVDLLGIAGKTDESYGYNIDGNGHRYLQIGKTF